MPRCSSRVARLAAAVLTLSILLPAASWAGDQAQGTSSGAPATSLWEAPVAPAALAKQAADTAAAPGDVAQLGPEPFVPPGMAGEAGSPTADPLASFFDDDPLGFVGRRNRVPPRPRDLSGSDYFPVEDRWRIGFPQWDRFIYGRPIDPYNLNVLKGDYPIIGQDIFFAVTLFSDSFFESRKLPVRNGTVNQTQFRQNFLPTFDLFRGNNFFRPAEWFIRITPAFNITDLTGQGTNDDEELQEGFIDRQLAVVSDYYDTVNLRVGRQGFFSDFRGFLFADVNDAVRLFGTQEGNRWQWNLFAFKTVRKDAVSQFNTFDSRDQVVAGANLVRQDFNFLGFNVNLSAVYDGDYFKNNVNVVYLEAAGDGHIGRFNVSAAVIEALGRDDFNPIARRDVTINGQFAALELAYPIDWIVPKISFLFASGDASPGDGQARGFDSIFDNPFFAGDGFSYLNREAIQPGGVQLSNTFSFLPNLRTKANDPANFVNPGLLLCNMGFDATISTRLFTTWNLNYYYLPHSEPVEAAALAGGKAVIVGREIGIEPSIGIIYKPLIVNNLVWTTGASALIPGSTIKSLSSDSQTLYTTFTAVTVIY